MNCNCPITDCQAQPTSQFFLSILTDKDTIAKVTPLPPLITRPVFVRERAAHDVFAVSSPSVRERLAQRLRGVLLQPDVVHQPSGLRPDPLQGEHGQHGHLLQVLLVLLLQLQLPRGQRSRSTTPCPQSVRMTSADGSWFDLESV